MKIEKTYLYPKFLQWPISSDNFSWYILFQLHIFLYMLAKIFDSSNIFEEISIFEGLRRFFKIPKNLRLCLRSFFWTRRFFVFGPFSIFVATLLCSKSFSQSVSHCSVCHYFILVIWSVSKSLGHSECT